ncbi:MAG TPA: biotin/lipoyl-containing protein, partial [Clostridia bacterium]|nr:biotin/lipoyl-containing protein [Clostridia bacterium]
VRPVFEQFESDLKSATAEIYKYEIPGGQYSNLKPQVDSFGLGHRFDEVKGMYKTVNEMLGDIIKVTPSSKTVGDMAIFMVQNDLDPENIYEKAKDMTFPESVVDYFKGMLGQPSGGFPKRLQDIVLKGETPISVRPGELLEPEDFGAIAKHLEEKYSINPNRKDILSYALYPKTYEDYMCFINEYGDLSRMGSDIFFHGLHEGETCEVEIAEGKVLILKLLEIGKLDNEGNRTLAFEVNGNRREIKIFDKASIIIGTNEQIFTQMADPENKFEIGATIPGAVVKILVEEGEKVDKNQSIILLEAMKMETNITAPAAGIVESILVEEKQQVKVGELLMKLKEE